MSENLYNKLIKNFISITIIIFLSFIVIIIMNESFKTENYLKKEKESLPILLTKITEDSIWNLDYTNAKKLVKIILEKDWINEITYKDIKNREIFSYKKNNNITESEIMKIPLIYKSEHIGDFFVYTTKAFLVYNIMIYSAIIIIFFIPAIFLFIFIIKSKTKNITSPIEELSSKIKGIDIKKMNIIDEKINNSDITEVYELINSFLGFQNEIVANYEEITAMNEELTGMNEELETSYNETSLVSGNLTKLISLMITLNEDIECDEAEFLSNIFHTALELIPQADCGSIYKYERNSVHCIDAVKHNVEKLRKVKIPSELFSIDKDVMIMKEENNILNLEEPEFIQLNSAMVKVKETLATEFYIDGKPVGVIFLDISKNNTESFNENSILIFKAFKQLATSYYKIKKYQTFREDFTKQIILAITRILEIHDSYTKGHSENVADLSRKLADHMGLSKEIVNKVYWAGLLHDIGKILVPSHILNKNSKLGLDEYEVIKNHPVYGYETLKASNELKDIADYILCHHEKWDGSGYPNGLKEHEIPLISQIIGICDSWDAMTSKRSYRNPMPMEKVIGEIIINSGKQFSPEIVDYFSEMMNFNEYDV